MRGDERVRFCDHCGLSVFNISALSRNEAKALIAGTEGRICARLYRRADGTVLTKDCPIGLRALRRRLTKRAAAIFAALVSLSSAALGQQPSKKSEQEGCIPQTRITRTTSQSNSDAPVLSGTVLDQVGAAIPNAKVLITNTGSQETQSVSSKDDGTFQFKSLPEGTYSITIEAFGFKRHLITAVIMAKGKLTNIEVLLEFVAGETVTVGILMSEPSVIDLPPATTIIRERDNPFRRPPWD
jgi:hypothetical protein